MQEIKCCGTCEYRDIILGGDGSVKYRCRMWMQAGVQDCRDSCDGQVSDPCVPWCVSSGTLEKYKAMRPKNCEVKDED